jgi:hypothetical protein
VHRGGSLTSESEAPDRRTGVQPPFDGKILIPLAVAKVGLQLLTANLYGAHRDEFYYLESGHHLAWGYVDNPPLVPAAYRLEEFVFGHSVFGLAVLPAFLGGIYVVLGGLLARELGGRRFAQLLTGVVAWLGSLFLTTSHFLSTVSFDLVFWALGSLLVMRMIRTGEKRLWVAIGVICGIGLLNKYTMGFWIVATLVGLLLTPQRRILASLWLPVGAVIAAVLVAPNIAWEFAHHWPTLEFLRNLRAGNAHTDLTQFVPQQLLLLTVGGAIVWITALVMLARSEWRNQRWLLIGYAVAFVIILALAGKPYYLGSWYLPLVALGSAAIEARWRRGSQQVVLAVVVVTGLLLAPFATPLLPESAAVRAHIDTANADIGGMMGWPSVVDSIADDYRQLPVAQQRHAVVLTDNYSEAGAVDFYGPSLELPSAISGHNSFWMWGFGHPSPHATVIAVGLTSDVVHRYWGSVVRVGTLGIGPVPVDPHERGAAIWICRDQKVAWSTLWPALKHYD